MTKKKEFATEEWVFASKDKVLYRERPMTNIEELMELAPFQDSWSPSLEATADLKELIGQAIDDLTPEDKWIFNALIVERLSLRGAGRILGIPKTSLARRRDRIRRELMAKLIKSKPIEEWLKR
jgi:DNA-directed RNA polymerase specialized sigma24 family protein